MPLLDLLTSPSFLLPAAIWSTTLKGFALWRACRRKQLGWFIALLVINTLGIFEAIYLIATHQWKKPALKPKTAIDELAAAEEELTPRRQAILHILLGILDEEHRQAVSQRALNIAITAIEDHITGNIDKRQLRSMLDKPESKGGAGFYKQTAEKITDHVDAAIRAVKE